MYATIVGNEPNVTFTLSGVDASGFSFKPDVVFSDGETSDSGERNIATTDGTPWSLIETEGTGGVVIGVQTDTIEFQNTQSGVSVYRSEEVQTLTWSTEATSVGDGKQGFVIAFSRPIDTDSDGTLDHLDLDSEMTVVTM